MKACIIYLRLIDLQIDRVIDHRHFCCLQDVDGEEQENAERDDRGTTSIQLCCEKKTCVIRVSCCPLNRARFAEQG